MFVDPFIDWLIVNFLVSELTQLTGQSPNAASILSWSCAAPLALVFGLAGFWPQNIGGNK
jgi:hypothetical protein